MPQSMVAATAADRTFVAEMVDYLSSMAQEEKTLFDNTINAARQYAVVFKMPYKLFRSASTTFAQDFGTKMEAYLCSMSAEEKRTFDHTIATAIRGREAAIIKHDNKTTQDEEAAATVTTIAAQEGEGGLNAFWAKMGQDEKVAAAGISPPRKKPLGRSKLRWELKFDLELTAAEKCESQVSLHEDCEQGIEGEAGQD